MDGRALSLCKSATCAQDFEAGFLEMGCIRREQAYFGVPRPMQAVNYTKTDPSFSCKHISPGIEWDFPFCTLPPRSTLVAEGTVPRESEAPRTQWLSSLGNAEDEPRVAELRRQFSLIMSGMGGRAWHVELHGGQPHRLPQEGKGKQRWAVG